MRQSFSRQCLAYHCMLKPEIKSCSVYIYLKFKKNKNIIIFTFEFHLSLNDQKYHNMNAEQYGHSVSWLRNLHPMEYLMIISRSSFVYFL